VHDHALMVGADPDEYRRLALFNPIQTGIAGRLQLLGKVGELPGIVEQELQPHLTTEAPESTQTLFEIAHTSSGEGMTGGTC